VKQADIDESRILRSALTTAEREESGRLRRDVKRLEMDREVLKRATAFLARESR
jgi:transposase